MMRKTGMATGIVVVGLALTGCGSSPMGVGRTLPDETAVVDAPPLTLPPSFELRPPRDGSGTGEELLRQPTAQPIEADDAWLVKQAGRVDPNIRQKLAAPVPAAEAETPAPKEDAQPAPAAPAATGTTSPVRDDSSFWNIWGGWKPADEQK